MYDCNITFVSGSVELESSILCEYINYHIIMMALFGTMSALLMLTTIVLISYYGRSPSLPQSNSIELCIFLVSISLLLSLGFDGALVILYLLSFAVIIYTAIQLFFFERAARMMGSGISGTSWNDVHPSPDQHDATISVSVAGGSLPIRESILDDQLLHLSESVIIGVSESCSICLETDNGTWVTTACGHNFHAICIQKWQNGTCPLCRENVI